MMMEEVLRVLKETKLSKIVLIKKEKNQLVVWKDVYDERSHKNEVKALKKLKNRPDIVQYHKRIKVGNSRYIELEYIDGENLEEMLSKKGPLEESKAKILFKKLALAVFHCHQCRIFHRDIKLSNVMIKGDGTLKLIDFGIACFGTDDTVFKKLKGTPLYAAPQILSNQPYLASKVDVFSLGMLLHELVTGELPFVFEERVKAIKNDQPQPEIKFPSKISLSDDLKDLIVKMTESSEEKRLSMDQVLLHPWINISDLSPHITKKRSLTNVIFSSSSKSSE